VACVNTGHALKLSGLRLRPSLIALLPSVESLTAYSEEDSGLYLCGGDEVAHVFQAHPLRPPEEEPVETTAKSNLLATPASLSVTEEDPKGNDPVGQALGHITLQWCRAHPATLITSAHAVESEDESAIAEREEVGSLSKYEDSALNWVSIAPVLASAALPPAILEALPVSVRIIAPSTADMGDVVHYGVHLANHTSHGQDVRISLAETLSFLCSGCTRGTKSLPPLGNGTIWFTLIPVSSGSHPLPAISAINCTNSQQLLHPKDNQSIFIKSPQSQLSGLY
jgi:hypothetical protein